MRSSRTFDSSEGDLAEVSFRVGQRAVGGCDPLFWPFHVRYCRNPTCSASDGHSTSVGYHDGERRVKALDKKICRLQHRRQGRRVGGAATGSGGAYPELANASQWLDLATTPGRWPRSTPSSAHLARSRSASGGVRLL